MKNEFLEKCRQAGIRGACERWKLHVREKWVSMRVSFLTLNQFKYAASHSGFIGTQNDAVRLLTSILNNKKLLINIKTAYPFYFSEDKN